MTKEFRRISPRIYYLNKQERKAIEFKVKSGRHTETTTTVKEDGWVDQYEGLFGGKMTYEFSGGSVLPG